MTRYAQTALALLALATSTLAQTFTTCNPLKTTCPDDPALGTTFYTTFNSTMTEFDPRFFNVSAGLNTNLISFSDDGAELTIVKQGDSVTIETAFYIMFGKVEMIMKAAEGQGIISTYNLLSDDLDEIDLEIKGGNYTLGVTNNYYGWGNTSQDNHADELTTGSQWGPKGAMGGFHNYTVDWE